MAATSGLPAPHLHARPFGARRIPVLTDDALFDRTGVRIAFTGRAGGVSVGPYADLNLAGHVGDDPAAVADNRRRLLAAMGASEVPMIMANQVHGTTVVELSSDDPEALDAVCEQARAGADAIAVGVPNVAALLCYADCVSLIVVSPSGRFVVVHAGWRGALAGIAGKAASQLAHRDAEDLCVGTPGNCNAYIGPHIHAECFETGTDVCDLFVERYGERVAPDERHVDLARAVADDLEGVGVSSARIAHADICTACAPERYFSYRASGGTCGRHGAFAVLQKG